MTKTRRTINFRPCLIIFAMTVTAILFSLVAAYVLPLGIALICVLAAALIYFTVACAVRREYFRMSVYITAFALCAIAVFAFFITLTYRYELKDKQTYTLSGRVTEHCSVSEGVFSATLDSVTADGKRVAGNISLTAENMPDGHPPPDCGDIVYWTSAVTINALVGENGVNASSVRSDIRYYAYTEGDKLIFTDGEPEALEVLRLGLRDKLIESMDEQTGAIAFGMIAGDRYLISDEVSESFAGAGIGHILAVSGLHIGLVAMLISFVLSKLGLPYAPRAAVSTALLLLYVIFTGGSPSAVRAFVMCAIALWARYFGLRDHLSALCAAGTVCLMISPFYLFECGFLMSMGAVYGLITFSVPISKIFAKTGMPAFLANGIAASLSVQIAIVPITAVFFSKLYVYSTLVNALAMPLLGAVYTGMLMILPFTFIPPFAPLILIPYGALWIITALSAAVTALPFAVITVRYSVAAVSALPASFVSSRFILRLGTKTKFALFIATILIVALFCGNAVHTKSGIAIIGGGAAATVLIHNDVAYLVADFSSGQRVSNAISRSRLLCEDFVIFEHDMDDRTAEGIINFAREYNVIKVVFPLTNQTQGYKRLVDAGIKAENVGENDMFDVAYFSGKPCGWLCKSGGASVFVTDGFAEETIVGIADITRAKAYYGAGGGKVYTAWDTSAGENCIAVTRGNDVVINF